MIDLERKVRVKNGRKASGFSLLEILIIVAIVGTLVTLALPFWFRAQSNTAKNTCINNLRIVSIGKELFAITENMPNGTVVTSDEIAPYLGHSMSLSNRSIIRTKYTKSALIRRAHTGILMCCRSG